MINILLIASGGALGAVLRFTTTGLIKNLFLYSFIGTLIVNIIGSFLIGLFIYLIQSKNLSEEFTKYFLIIGLLGSYTTFSAFSLEIVDLLKDVEPFKENLKYGFIINRKIVNTAIGRDVTEALTEFEIPVLNSQICQRVSFAESAANGQTV